MRIKDLNRVINRTKLHDDHLYKFTVKNNKNTEIFIIYIFLFLYIIVSFNLEPKILDYNHHHDLNHLL